MEIFERAKANIHPQQLNPAPTPEEGIKRANVGASLLCKQTLYPEIDLTNPLPPIADNTQPLSPFPLDLSSSNGGKLPPPITRNDVIYPSYLMKPRLKPF